MTLVEFRNGLAVFEQDGLRVKKRVRISDAARAVSRDIGPAARYALARSAKEAEWDFAHMKRGAGLE